MSSRPRPSDHPLLATRTAPEETAAILVEPVLGEGGYVVPPLSVLKGAEEICRMLLLTCGAHDHVIRFIPPLVVTEAQIDEAVVIFEKALQSAEAARAAGSG